MIVFHESPLRQLSALAVPGSPYGLAPDSTQPLVWVTLTGLNQVVGISVSGGTPVVVARLDTVAQPDTVAVAPGSRTLWVAGNRDGVVQRLTR